MKTNRLNDFFESKTYKIISSKVYGIGAAIVIIGSLFKILHLPGAAIALGSGLIIEALIFLVSAFEPIHEEVDWTLAYPQLKGANGNEFENQHSTTNPNPSYYHHNTGFNNNLSEIPNLSPDQFAQLKNSLLKLGKNADNIGLLSDVSVASNGLYQNLIDASQTTEKFHQTMANDIKKHERFSKKIEDATENIDTISIGYKTLSDEINQSIKNTSSNFNKLDESIQVNYEAYNNLSYHVSTTANHYKEKITQLNKSIYNAEDINSQEREILSNVKQLQEEMKGLKSKISSLNEVYNNMLVAVNHADTSKTA